MLAGWILSGLSATGNSCIDVSKKLLMKSNLAPTEMVSLISGVGFFGQLVYIIYLNEFSLGFTLKGILGIILDSFFIIISEILYMRALSMAPLSEIIPFLSTNQAFVLLFGILLLGEVPSLYGLIGSFLVFVGVYLISNESAKKKGAIILQEVKNTKKNLISTMLENKAGLYMLLVALIWAFSNVLEKIILTDENIPPMLFFTVQRFFIAMPTLIYSIHKRPEFIDHIFISIGSISLVILSEILTVITLFEALNYIYVSYIVAVKRGGNILLSVLLDIFVYSERPSKATILACGIIVAGVIFIVFSQCKQKSTLGTNLLQFSHIYDQ